MKVHLTGVSTGVSFASGPQTQNFLDFMTEDGRTFRVAVDEAALETVVANVYGATAGVPPARDPVVEETLVVPELEDLPGVTSFGGDVEAEVLHEESEAADAFVQELAQEDGPGSEDEVPSL
jgi:hypothetical protein